MDKPEKLSDGTYGCQVTPEHYVKITKWRAGQALDFWLDLISLLGEPAGAMLGAMSSGLENVGPDGVSAILKALSTSLAANKVLAKRCIRTLAADDGRIVCNNKNIDYDALYSEDFALQFNVARASLEVQYGKLFQQWGSALGFKPANLHE